MSKITVGNNIKSRRKSLKITLKQLEELTGLSINTLYRIEKGLANPTLNSLEKIGIVLGLEMKIEVKSL